MEALSVEITVKSMTVRCCVAYGCQETDKIERKKLFWNYLDYDVFQAKNKGSGFILHFDGNLWAGDKIIPGDKKTQNRNGFMFEQFLERHTHLTVVNSLSLCEGLITRMRMKQGKLEGSSLDFFVVCSRIIPFVTKMVIDQDRKYILTNYTQVRKGGNAIDSDHFTQYMDVQLKYKNEKPVREHFFNLKNSESQELFKKLTSNTNQFT